MAQMVSNAEESLPLVRKPRELAMSAAWNAALAHEVETTDGRLVRIVYHGRWSNGFGPDFQDAMIDFGDGKLITGDIELHYHASDWLRHGHNLDTNYNNVVLHVVHTNDLVETRCINGRIVPMAVLRLPDEALFAIDQRLPNLWSELSGSVCAEALSGSNPDVIRQAIHSLGDARLRAKAAAFEAEILEFGSGHVFLKALFGAFGYSANKAPMEHLAELVLCHGLSSARLAGPTDQIPSPWLTGVMLGMGGFLPLTPTDAHAAGILPEDQYRIERAWNEYGAGFAQEFVPATSWQMANVRPANHPAYRIMQLATLLTKSAGNPLEAIIVTVRKGESPVDLLRELTSRPWHPGIGAGRATAITASVVVPHLLAVAAIENDAELEDAAFGVWARLPMKEWTQPARRAIRQVTGGPTIRRLGERGHQGLLHLDRELCAPRRCNACPIAAAVIRFAGNDSAI